MCICNIRQTRKYNLMSVFLRTRGKYFVFSPKNTLQNLPGSEEQEEGQETATGGQPLGKFVNSQLIPFTRTFPGGFDDDSADLCALPPPQSSPQPSRALHPPGVFPSSPEKHNFEFCSCRRSRSAGARCLAASLSGSSYLASSRTCSSSSTPRPTFSSTASSVLGSGRR